MLDTGNGRLGGLVTPGQAPLAKAIPSTPTGWVCPSCRASNAPTERQCPSCTYLGRRGGA